MDTATGLATGLASRLVIGINGEERAFDGPLSVALLLARLGLDARKVAVERNKAIVRRAHYAETWLESGDAVEIVHFIGGG
jgi:thiamine biosynthesis protein ThiS